MDSALLIRITRSLVVALILAGLVTLLPGLYRIQVAEAADTPRPLSHFTETAMPATQRPVGGFCTDRTRIVQDCDFGALPGMRALEQAVIADAIKMYELPDARPGPVTGATSPLQEPQDNASRLLSWERDTLRTLLWDRIAVMVSKSPAGSTPAEQAQLDAVVRLAGKVPNPRTREEQAIVTALATLVQQRRLATATAAKNFYNSWRNDPCSFLPPKGFIYSPPNDCGIPNAISNVFSNPPSMEQFQAYGAYTAYEQYEKDPDLRAAAASAAKAYGFLGGIFAAGIAGFAAYTFATSTALGGSIAAAISPFGGIALEGSVAAGVAAGTAAGTASAGTGAVGGVGSAGASSVAIGAAGLGAAVVIVVTALVIAGIAGYTAVTASELPGKLDEAITAARTAPDLYTLIDSAAGKQEIFAAYLPTTVPAPNSPTLLGGLTGWSPVPAARPDDQAFLVNPGPAGQVSAYLVFKGWNRTGRVRLSQGWFVDENAPGGPALTLHLDYLNPEGERWTNWRRGNSFLQTTDSNVKPSRESTLFVFQDLNGALSSAMINAASGGPPTASPTTFPPPNEFGWNNTAVTVVWNWHDNSGRGLEPSACPVRTEMLRGETVFLTCRDRAGTMGTASVTANIDTTPPQFNGPPTVSPTPNAAGWNNTDVTITFACNDGDLPGMIVFENSVSGVSTCGPDRRLVTEGIDQYVRAQAEDLAGNTNVQRFGPFNIDKTPPRFVTTPTDQTVTSTTPTGGPVPDVAATDNLDPSPVVSCMPAIGSPLPLGSTRVTCTARDAAGNATAPVSFTVNVVKAPSTSAPRGTGASVGTDSLEEAHGGRWQREPMLRREHGYA